MVPDDTITDDTSLALRATADLFDQSADVSKDPHRRDMLHEFARLYREMAALAEASDADVDDEPA